jgi:hypothetical protein
MPFYGYTRTGRAMSCSPCPRSPRRSPDIAKGLNPARVRFDLNESCTSTRRVMSQRIPLPMDGSPFGFSGPLMAGGCAGGGSGAGMRFRWLVGTRGTCDS